MVVCERLACVTTETCSVRVLGTEGGAALWPFEVIVEWDGRCIPVTPDAETLEAEEIN